MRELTREEQMLLHLLAVTPQPPLPEEVLLAVDWQQVMHESVQQAVSAQAFDAAARYMSYIPSEVYQTWFLRVAKVLSNNARVGKAQAELVTLLNQAGYPYCILKGAASAAYYPRPDLRTLGDVDFLIDSVQKEKIETVLLSNGYSSSGYDHKYHIAFTKAGVHLEMHYAIPGIPLGLLGETVCAQVADLLETTLQAQMMDSCLFHVPDPVKHGLILLLHMQQHMLTEGIGLRHLLDWGMYVRATEQESFWERLFLPFLKTIGLYRYASVMTAICQKYLCLAEPAWLDSIDDKICKDVMVDIFTGGNFGRKQPVRSKAGVMVSVVDRNGTSDSVASNIWRALWHGTKKKYPITAHVKILLPVFVIWRCLCYGVRAVSGKRASVVEMIPLAQERRAVYEQLHIFEIEKSGDER